MAVAMQETWKRSIVKTVTYRAIGITVMTAAGFILSGSWKVGIGVGLVDMCLGFVSYFVHERVWNFIPWGKK